MLNRLLTASGCSHVCIRVAHYILILYSLYSCSLLYFYIVPMIKDLESVLSFWKTLEVKSFVAQRGVLDCQLGF